MADTLALAIAIAASPFPIIPAILLLFTPRAKANSWSFLCGWFTGVAVATTVFVLLAEFVDRLDEPPAWASITRIALGLVLVAWGIRQWVTRRADSDLPGWMAALDTATPTSAARLSLLLSAANPKIVLLAAAAGLAMGSAGEAPPTLVAWVLVFALIASISVAIPVVLYAVRGDRVLTPLGRARDWLQRNNGSVMAVVFIVIGLAALAKGVSSL
jgi:threonine/homoserine/homoserine lactone efflux protein